MFRQLANLQDPFWGGLLGERNIDVLGWFPLLLLSSSFSPFPKFLCRSLFGVSSLAEITSFCFFANAHVSKNSSKIHLIERDRRAEQEMKLNGRGNLEFQIFFLHPFQVRPGTLEPASPESSFATGRWNPEWNLWPGKWHLFRRLSTSGFRQARKMVCWGRFFLF